MNGISGLHALAREAAEELVVGAGIPQQRMIAALALLPTTTTETGTEEQLHHLVILEATAVV
jgi:hypothetical protein